MPVLPCDAKRASRSDWGSRLGWLSANAAPGSPILPGPEVDERSRPYRPVGEHVVPAARARGVFEELAIGIAPGTVGWVIQGYADERIERHLTPTELHRWEDARSRGKVPGQPVLFLQSRPRDSRWVGWGRVVEPEERWRVLGVTVRCEEVVRSGLPVVVSRSVRAPRSGDAANLPEHEWEYRELGQVLGVDVHRDRTPYLDADARDLRLSIHDLHFLLQLQPALGRLGRGRKV